MNTPTQIQRQIKMVSTALLLLGVALIATAGHSSEGNSVTVEQLRERAHKVFEHDRVHKGLPSNKLFALSIALKFRDLKGAEKALSLLESKMAEKAIRTN